MLPLMKKVRSVRYEENRFITRWAQAVLDRQNGACEVKRDRWTENDVLSLPSGEQDFFERKGARLLDDNGKFLDAVAKACSAFANSGGGSLLLGVEDDGTLTGVDPQKGGEPLNDWLEQKIPNLLDYRMSDFRVHVVEPAKESCIPEGKIVIVIDVGDSALAPHQSQRDKFYYHRVAGRSAPAPHFYLDLLRQRLASPALEFGLNEVNVSNACVHDNGIFVQLNLAFWIRNNGRVAAYRWRLRLNNAVSPLVLVDRNKTRDFFVDPQAFPVRWPGRGGISMDDTILPGDVRGHMLELGVLLRPTRFTNPSVITEISGMIGELVITCQLATETSPGAPVDISLADHLDLERVFAAIVGYCGPAVGLSV
jgi:hypothetical protein